MSRQAYYQRGEKDFARLALEGFILEYVQTIRVKAPKIGCYKLFVMCETYFKDIWDMGRDAFYALLRRHGKMLRRKCRHHCHTTDSNHGYPVYPNLTEGLVPTAINQLWVSDITYIWTLKGFNFLSVVTDAYSHEIIGHCLAPTLAYHYTEQALDMALATLEEEPQSLIHHSDRGLQYAYASYTDKLKAHGIRISMTQSGDPKENPMAERVNGILKEEFLNSHEFKDIEDVREVLEKAIQFYNTERPHASIDFLTPQVARTRTGEIRNRWKKKKKKTGSRDTEAANGQIKQDCLKMLNIGRQEELIQTPALSLHSTL